MIAEDTSEFREYLNSFASREFVPLDCPQCNRSFTKVKHDIQSKFGAHNNRETICCSRACLYKSLMTAQIVNCAQCGKSFEKYLNQIKRSPNHFCSSSCLGIYHNAHKAFGSRRSKLENWLEIQLLESYKDIEFIFNGTKAINSELDIYIPAIKLAFEIDGIFHFKPIYGEEKFQVTQNNDIKKIKACSEANIELVKIDISSMKKFTPIASVKYLEIIKKEINAKLI